MWRGEKKKKWRLRGEAYKNGDRERKGEDETNPSGREEKERVYDSPA